MPGELAARTDRRLERLKREKLSRAVDRLYANAIKAAAGLFEDPIPDADGKPTNPKYNPDADRPWTFASTKTRAGVMLAMKAADQKRENGITERAFGVALLSARITNKEDWEKYAGDVDEAGTKPIDVEVVPPEAGK